jgi:CubicO group peptidase (beta-lactamase class C family)
MSGDNRGFGLTEDYITKVMVDWGVPGLSIAIVKAGNTMYSKGFGICHFGSNQAVDEHTLFRIGSCTKAFTTTTIALLVADGKLSWNDPVRKFLPDFAMADEEVAAQLTLRDMASHQSGVDDDFATKSYNTPEDAIKSLMLLKPVNPWRKGFSYNNALYLLLGKVVEKVSGVSWETFLQTRIFNPLAMKKSRPTQKAAEAEANRASAHDHSKPSHQMQVIPGKNEDFIAPVSALQSNVVDLAVWLKFHLGTLEASKQSILSQLLLDEMHSEEYRITSDSSMLHPGSTWYGQGLGWFIRDYMNSKLVQHGGFAPGFTSFVAINQAQGFGVVVLTNMNKSLAPFVLAYGVIDAYLGVEPTDWNAYFLAKRAEHRSKVALQKQE